MADDRLRRSVRTGREASNCNDFPNYTESDSADSIRISLRVSGLSLAIINWLSDYVRYKKGWMSTKRLPSSRLIYDEMNGGGPSLKLYVYLFEKKVTKKFLFLRR